MGPRAFCFDLDGTLYQGGSAIPGAVELIARLRAADVPCRFLSNTTSRPRARIAARMRSYGFAIEDDEILNATRAGGLWLDAQGIRKVAAFVPDESKPDLGRVEHVGDGPVEAVVIGDMAGAWTDAHLQEAFSHLMAGAELVALSRDRFWHDGARLVMDCGGYVAALEHASGKQAHVVGKPSAAFFQAALASLGGDIPAQDVVMVGDDIETDVGGAQRAGLQGWLVQTGKYDAARVAASGVRPERVLRNVAVLGSV
jgi:HAD superfamily hydrolase (TIGR01458 family)